MPTSLTELAGSKGGYYDRTNISKNFDKHIFIAGRILQSAEMNEIQTQQQNQLKGIADALFKDGDIVRDCRCAIDKDKLTATLEKGAIYAQGQVRGVGDASITIPATGTISIGIWLITEVITDADDKDLLDPAAGNRGFNEPGAYRLRSTPRWGLENETVANGTFFPVYYVDDAQLRAKEPPPNLDAVTQAIARYDVDSNGSNYIVNGFRVTRLPDTVRDHQVYSIAAGRGRVNGFGVMTNAAYRYEFDAQPDLRAIAEEPAGAPAAGSDGRQRINVRFTPIASVDHVLIIKEQTYQYKRGSTPSDPIPITGGDSLENITSIKVGTTSYVQNVHWSIDTAARNIVWADPTIPPSGSTVDLVYQVRSPYPLADIDADDNGFYVKDAMVASSGTVLYTVFYGYSYKQPRVDRLCFNDQGKFVVIKGIATDNDPAPPPVPSNLLSLCQIHQAWTNNFEDTWISNDGVRMVSMGEIEKMNNRLDDITDMVAQLSLISDINVRDANKKIGLFVDPFTNDSQRDAGYKNQTAAVAGNCLQLPITSTPLSPEPANGIGGITEVVSCDFVEEVILGNNARTSDMKVNPYMAFAPFPAQVQLIPQIDRWVDTKTAWTSPETRYFTTTVYAPWTTQWGMHMTQNYVTGQSTVNELASTSTADSEYLRQIEVHFTISGFIPGETLTRVMFDTVAVTPTA
ncbi:DUF4815 domain-containing protein [Enterobacter hormaechei]|nr:DUF4815 domain-containing protein [Enterobacter hormaechei]